MALIDFSDLSQGDLLDLIGDIANILADLQSVLEMLEGLVVTKCEDRGNEEEVRVPLPGDSDTETDSDLDMKSVNSPTRIIETTESSELDIAHESGGKPKKSLCSFLASSSSKVNLSVRFHSELKSLSRLIHNTEIVSTNSKHDLNFIPSETSAEAKTGTQCTTSLASSSNVDWSNTDTENERIPVFLSNIASSLGPKFASLPNEARKFQNNFKRTSTRTFTSGVSTSSDLPIIGSCSCYTTKNSTKPTKCARASGIQRFLTLYSNLTHQHVSDVASQSCLSCNNATSLRSRLGLPVANPILSTYTNQMSSEDEDFKTDLALAYESTLESDLESMRQNRFTRKVAKRDLGFDNNTRLGPLIESAFESENEEKAGEANC